MATSIQTQNSTQVCSFEITFFNTAIELVFLLHSRICGTIWYFQGKVYWAQGTKCLIEKGLA